MSLRLASYVTAWVALGVAAGPSHAQTPPSRQASYDSTAKVPRPAAFRRVSWRLLDIVTLPDPCTGFRLIVAPAPRTTAWRERHPVVQFGLDPVQALQWAGLARGFAQSDTMGPAKSKAPVRYLPAIRPPRGHRVLLVADYGTRAKPDRRFVLVVSDSSQKVDYKTFASAAQLEDLAQAVEASAELGRQHAQPNDTTVALTDDTPWMDTPVGLGHIGQLHYPTELMMQRRIGRVWIQYVVNAEGRVEEGSFQTLLSDDERFTDSVVRLLREATFRPATSRGVPVRQRVFQVFDFTS